MDLGNDACPILGAVALDKFLILLTKNKLYQVKVEFQIYLYLIVS